MQILKNIGFVSFAGLVSLEQTFAAISFDSKTIQTGVKGSENSAETAIQNIVGNVMLFIGIVAVLFGLYGGFLILTAAGADDQVKKGKTIIIQVMIGIVVIFLANSIIKWILGIITGA